MDTGSLFQLRNLINRRNVVTDVTKDLTACEEFMELVTTGHVLAAAIHITGTTDMSGLSHNLPSRGSSFMNAVTVVKTLCQQMVTVKVAKGRSAVRRGSVDHVQETLSLGLLLLEFKDPIREGDGYRVIRCWKFFFGSSQKHSDFPLLASKIMKTSLPSTKLFTALICFS